MSTTDDKPAHGKYWPISDEAYAEAILGHARSRGIEKSPEETDAEFLARAEKLVQAEDHARRMRSERAACPFWGDGQHCWGEESLASDGFRGKPARGGSVSMAVKSCACGVEVSGKTAPRG